MSRNTHLRMRISSDSLAKAARLASNTLLLGTNAYLLGASARSQLQASKRDRLVQNLQLTAEIASTVAGLSQVVTENLRGTRAIQ